eukprot:78573_1
MVYFPVTKQYTFIITYTLLISLSAEQIWCNKANSCTNNAIVLSNPSNYPTLYGNGYRSLHDAAISVNITKESCGYATIWCGGAFACNNLSYVKNVSFIQCYGSNTCSDINGNAFVQTKTCQNAEATQFWGTSKRCYGSNACQYTNFQNTNNIGLTFNDVECSGDQSCANTNIQKSGTIMANAAYSLYNAVIDSKDLTSALDVTLRGYHAGFGSKIICRSGDYCSINCVGNACEGLYVECEDTNNCNVELFNPATMKTEFDQSKLNLFYNSSILTRNNDEACNSQLTNFTVFDAYQQQGGYNGGEDIVIIGNTTSGPICCRGKESCTNIENIMMKTANKESIICSGDATCSSWNGYGSAPTINNNGAVYCEGYQSCIGSNIITNDNVYCLAGESCKQSTISGAQNIYCSGSNSCLGSTIVSAGTDINLYLLGYLSRPNKIYCNQTDICFIFCGGGNSCVWLDEILFCHGICNVKCVDGLNLDCPTINPTIYPTINPTINSTIYPTINPTIYPTINSTINPTIYPTIYPIVHPIFQTNKSMESRDM